jgi:predicted type IV restriction endonuclease
VSDRVSERLIPTLEHLASRLRGYRGRVLGEQNTKSTLIEPLLESLGWDTRDFDEVHHEFKPRRADRPVDYALQLHAKPVVFLEAKGLGENLNDRR